MLILLFLSGLFHCTELPYGGNEISSGHRKISGKVELHDGGSPENVYVWLSNFDIGTRTDKAGEFTIILPPKSVQAVSGTFTLYYYIANYLLASSEVVTRDGEFVYDQGDINKKGQLCLPKVLRRFLSVTTSVSPSSVTENYTETIKVTVSLRATIDSVTVIIPGSSGYTLGAVFIRKLDSPGVFIYESIPGLAPRRQLMIGSVPTTLKMTFNLVMKPLAKGKYEVVPYVLPAHQKIPVGLMQSIGADVEGLNTNYLNIPFRREGGEFEVR